MNHVEWTCGSAAAIDIYIAVGFDRRVQNYVAASYT